MLDGYFIIIDGANVAYSRRDHDKRAMITNIDLFIQYLKELKSKYSVEYEIITDANLKYRIDDKNRLDEYYKRGIINECPASVKADIFIIEYYSLEPEKTIIISNDGFADYSFHEEHDYALCKYMIINRRVIIPKLMALIGKQEIRKEQIISNCDIA